MITADRHFLLGTPLYPPYPADTEQAVFGMGCFWGAERKFWKIDGVYSTMVGYTGGHTQNSTYHEVCTGLTGHAEVVRIVFYPSIIPYETILRVFWQSHNPTQVMRQGNDIGTQYRSVIYVDGSDQMACSLASREEYQTMLTKSNFGKIATEIVKVSEFYYAEPYHQQYLAKNPHGYCGLGGTGVKYA